MPESPRGLRGLLVAVCLLTVVACGGDNPPSPSQSGPGQALQAAAAAMRMVNAFRFTAEVTSGSQIVHVSGEFSSPDGLHEVVQVDSHTLELVRIGARTFRRDTSTSPWQLTTAASSPAPTDPRTAFTALASNSAVTLKGSSYLFTLTNGAAAGLVNGSKSVSGSALLTDGRISDLKYEATNPAVAVHLTYSDFNATPAVTPPM